ncbi:MAG: hypothetical protein L0312_24185 [Acidobacteria bacterium]|nr:hypothetical protein [Acidobacteriota bacterium]
MIPRWLQELARGRNVLFALVVWLGFGVLLFQFTSYPTLQAANNNQPLLEERLGYTADEAKQQMQALGEWRASYRNFQILDYINAILMGCALTLALTFTLTRLFGPGNPIRLLALLPIVAVVGEFLENTLLIVLTSSYPDISSGLVGVASAATSLKLAIGMITLTLTALSLIALGVKSLFTRRS